MSYSLTLRRLLGAREKVLDLPRVRGRPAGGGQGVPGVLRGGGRRPLPAVQAHGRLRVVRSPHEEVRRVQVRQSDTLLARCKQFVFVTKI